MAHQPLKVYISSTRLDLEMYKTTIYNAIIVNKMNPFEMKDIEPKTPEAVAERKRNVETADLLIGIYGEDYGYIPDQLPPEAQDMPGKAITEMEFLWAENAGIDRMVFTLNNPSKRPPNTNPRSDVPSPSSTPLDGIQFFATPTQKQMWFLQHVREQTEDIPFDAVDDLGTKATSAIAEWKKWCHWLRLSRHSNLLTGILIVLVLAIVIVTAQFGYLLFSAGQAIMSLFAALVAFAGIFLGFLKLPLRQIHVRVPAACERLVSIGLLALLLLVSLLVQPLITKALADQQYTSAVHAGNPVDAQTALKAAQTLGMDVLPPLQRDLLTAINDPNAPEEPMLLVAALARQYHAADAALLTRIRQDMDDALSAGSSSQMQRIAHALVTLDAKAAGVLAHDYNDSGVDALQAGNLDTARLYLETVAVLDQYDDGRSDAAKSIALMNLGQLHDLKGETDAALAAFRAAWETSSQNYEVAYSFASLVLVKQEASAAPDTAQLSDARDIAAQATSNSGCEQKPVSADQTQLIENDLCFRLLTTLAGLELTLKNNPTEVNRLVTRAVNIAEVTHQFSGLPYQVWTAEAYYYAMLLNPTPTLKTLCAVQQYGMPNSERARNWADKAKDQQTALYPGQECS